MALSEMAVDAVRIADRDGRDAGARGRDVTVTAIADGLFRVGQGLDLQDFTFERGDGRQADVRQGADAVDPDAEADHVELEFRETLDAGRVEDVPHRPVAEGFRDPVGVLPEQADLSEREGVLLRVLRHAQVREDGLDLHFGALPEQVQEFRQFAGHEAEPVHPRVQFDVDREIPESALPQDLQQLSEGEDVRDAGLQAVVDDFRVEVRAGGQDQHREGDTGLPEFHPFHGIGDGEVVRARPLHHGSELHGPVAVCVGLDQDQQFRLRFQPGAEIPVVLLTAPEIELQAREIVLSVHIGHKDTPFFREVSPLRKKTGGNGHEGAVPAGKR